MLKETIIPKKGDSEREKLVKAVVIFGITVIAEVLLKKTPRKDPAKINST